MPRTTHILLPLGCQVCAGCLAGPILLEPVAQVLLGASPRPLGDLEGLAELCRASGLAGEAVRKFLSDHVLSELPAVRFYSDKHY